MSVLDDFSELMIQSVTYRPVASRDVYGKPSYGASVSYRARVVHKTLRTSNQFSGQDWVGNGIIYLGAYITTIDPDDEWTLPDGSKPQVVRLENYPDEVGNYYSQVIFGGTGFGGNQ